MGRRAKVESGSQRLEAETGDPPTPRKLVIGSPEAQPTHRTWRAEGELRGFPEAAKKGLMDLLADTEEEGVGGWEGTSLRFSSRSWLRKEYWAEPAGDLESWTEPAGKGEARIPPHSNSPIVQSQLTAHPQWWECGRGYPPFPRSPLLFPRCMVLLAHTPGQSRS